MKSQLAEVIVRAMKDPLFKEALMKNPKQVLAEWNIPVPPACEVTVLQQSLDRVYVVLPPPEVIEKLQMDKKSYSDSNPLRTIIIRAVQDPEYKKELIQNSKKILEQECDIELPEHCIGEVVEETENKFYIIIPYAPNPNELSDSELSEIAAGGNSVNRLFGHLDQFSSLGLY